MEVYKKVADAVNNLLPKLHSTAAIVPIGIDGAITYHLLDNSMKKKMLHHEDYLGNTIQISSKANLMDMARFLEVFMREAGLRGKHIYALDLRTKSGKMADLLCSQVNDLKNDIKTMTVDYAVLFDHNKLADVRASEEEFTDEEKAFLRWFDKPEDAPIRQGKNGWNYNNVTHNKLSKLRHVQEIKNLI
jgi:hypothetical protein